MKRLLYFVFVATPVLVLIIPLWILALPYILTMLLIYRIRGVEDDSTVPTTLW